MRVTKWKPGDEVYGIRWRRRLGDRFEEGIPGVLVESFHHNGMLNHKVQVEGRGIRLFRKLRARTAVHQALEEANEKSDGYGGWEGKGADAVGPTGADG